MKQKALVMAEMQAFQNKRQEEDDILRNEIDDLLTALNKSESQLVFPVKNLLIC